MCTMKGDSRGPSVLRGLNTRWITEEPLGHLTKAPELLSRKEHVRTDPGTTVEGCGLWAACPRSPVPTWEDRTPQVKEPQCSRTARVQSSRARTEKDLAAVYADSSSRPHPASISGLPINLSGARSPHPHVDGVVLDHWVCTWFREVAGEGQTAGGV